MSARRRSKQRGDAGPGCKFRLYIVEGTPHSELAVSRFKAICEKYFGDRYTLEILDVLEHPCRILTDRILATPTLIKLSPEPQVRIIGDLSEEVKVLSALGIPATEA